MAGSVGPLQAQTLPNGVAAGDVDQTSAVVWARSTAQGWVILEYGESGADDEAVLLETEVVDPTIPVKFEITGLRPGTAYSYTITNFVEESVSGTFRTPHEAEYAGLRFGVTGDWRGELAPYPAIANIPDRSLDFLAVLGDTIYADVPSIDVTLSQTQSLEDFRRKHNEVYRERFDFNFWAEARASTALYAMFDDHEVTNDFAGGAAPGSDERFDQTGTFIHDTELYRNGLQAFHEFNPIREEYYGDTGDERTAGKQKCYRYRTFGSDAAIYLLDARTFRDEELDNIFNPFANREIRAFVEDSFDPERTMLGPAQIEDLFNDLIDAQDRGISWKFIMVPEPIQNLSPLVAGDRFEGYAHERSRLLLFIEEMGITNVVFVTADIHSTFINNITYQLNPDDRQRTTNTFEISTGPVAYAAPFGPTVLQYAPFGRLTKVIAGLYGRLNPMRQDRVILRTANRLLRWFGYSPVGLQRTSLESELTDGSYLAVNSFGWSEFEIDAINQELTVTTYGIPWYDQVDLFADPNEVLSRRPTIISQFTIDPIAEPEESYDRQLRRPSPCGAFGLIGLSWPLILAFFCVARKRAHFF